MRLWFVLYPDVEKLDKRLVEALAACRGDYRCAVTAARFADGGSVRGYTRYENGIEVDVDEASLARKPLSAIARALYTLGMRGRLEVDEKSATLILSDALELAASIYATSYGVNPATWRRIEPHPASANEVASLIAERVARLYQRLADAKGRVKLKGSEPTIANALPLTTYLSNEGGIAVSVGGFEGRRVLAATKGRLTVVVGGGERQVTSIRVEGDASVPQDEVVKAVANAVRALLALERGDATEFQKSIAYFDSYEVREGKSLPPLMEPEKVKLHARLMLAGVTNSPEMFNVICEGGGCNIESLLEFALRHPYLPHGDVAAPERGGLRLYSTVVAGYEQPEAALFFMLASPDVAEYRVVAKDGVYTEYIEALRPSTLYKIDVSIVEDVNGEPVFVLNTNEFSRFSVSIDTKALSRNEQLERYALFARLVAGADPGELLDRYRPKGVAKIAVCRLPKGCIYAVKTPRGWEKIEVYPDIIGVEEAMAWPEEILEEARKVKTIAILPKRMSMKAALGELMSLAKNQRTASATA